MIINTQINGRYYSPTDNPIINDKQRQNQTPKKTIQHHKILLLIYRDGTHTKFAMYLDAKLIIMSIIFISALLVAIKLFFFTKLPYLSHREMQSLSKGSFLSVSQTTSLPSTKQKRKAHSFANIQTIQGNSLATRANPTQILNFKPWHSQKNAENDGMSKTDLWMSMILARKLGKTVSIGKFRR